MMRSSGGDELMDGLIAAMLTCEGDTTVGRVQAAQAYRALSSMHQRLHRQQLPGDLQLWRPQRLPAFSVWFTAVDAVDDIARG